MDAPRSETPPPITSNTKPRTAATASNFSAEKYFATQPEPPTLAEDVATARAWVERQVSLGRRIVLVTSGGTTVPLELNVVRFLDNFSAGTRGATSAEYFLEHGYAVLFMHRQFSLQPFSRHYSHSTHPFLDVLDIDLDEEPISPPTAPSNLPAHVQEASSPASSPLDYFRAPPHEFRRPQANDQKLEISVKEDTRTHLAAVLKAYKRARAADALHTVSFVTVNDYLFLLRALATDALSLARHNVLFYLAAAVSDFFLPTQKMSEHKIQSGKGTLNIEMDQVPKILLPLAADWSANAFIVSFKLETDITLLLPKARQSLERYGHHAVVGNELHSRKWQIVLVSRRPDVYTNETGAPTTSGVLPTSSLTPAPTIYDERWVRLAPTDLATGKEIEEEIVAELVKRHSAWIASCLAR
ncbi:DFP-domain-containing protein [Auriculariales sp. MPI-PUGE-AT-0066]|nr:DFP-domain-containing protein [Auriculariales sp. MPI-PUGE-AT-0066]